MCNIELLKEFSKTHYTTLILERSLDFLITVPTFDISTKKDGPILIYNIQLPLDFNYAALSVTKLMSFYKIESIYAALCLSCLLPMDKTCENLANYNIFPQVEWYVKET